MKYDGFCGAPYGLLTEDYFTLRWYINLDDGLKQC